LHDFPDAALGDPAQVCLSARGWLGTRMGGSHAGAAAEAATLERRLAVRRRARADGAAGRPDAEARSIPAEQEIIDAIDQERGKLLRDRASIATSLEQGWRRLATSADEIEMHSAAARLSLRQMEGRLRLSLETAAARAEEAAGDLDAFKRREQVRWRARTPESLTLSTGMLVGLVAIEAVASAPIFADAMNGGLAQGYMAAVTLSGLNASIGLIGGFFGIRYLQRRDATLKWLGGLCTLAAVAFGIFFNVFASLWRARAVEDIERAEALRAMQRGKPFDAEVLAGQSDALSLLFDTRHGETFILLVLGIIVLIGALVKGATGFDDPVPDHGALTRAAEREQEDFADAQEDALEALDEPITSARQKIDALMVERRTALAAIRTQYDDAEAKLHALDVRLDDLALAQAMLIETYRVANMAARRTPPPPGFMTPPPQPDSPPDALERAGGLRAQAEAALSNLAVTARREIEALIVEREAVEQRLRGSAA